MKLFIWILLLRAGLAHPEIVLRQALLESNHFRSNLCVNHHNLFGIKRRGSNHYANFDSYQDCVLYYATHISPRYKGGDYYHFLKHIGYAADRHYIAKLRKITLKNMDRQDPVEEIQYRKAIIIDAIRLDPMAYILDTQQVAVIGTIRVQGCCGVPIELGKMIDASGQLFDSMECCGNLVSKDLKIGTTVMGRLDQNGVFVIRQELMVVGPANPGNR